MEYSHRNVRRIHHKYQELDNILNENVKIAIISESKKKLKGMGELENYIYSFSGVDKEQRTVSIRPIIYLFFLFPSYPPHFSGLTCPGT